MAHIGQEGAARSCCRFGVLLGQHQLLLHLAPAGQVGDQLHDLEGLPPRIQDGVVAALHPQQPPAFAHALVLPRIGLAAAQLAPQLYVAGIGHMLGRAQQAVVLAQHPLFQVTKQLAEVVVDRDDAPCQVVLHHGQRTVDGRHRAFELGIAGLERGVVHHHAIDILQHAVGTVDAARVFGHPAHAAIAVQQAVLHRIGFAVGQRIPHLLPESLGIFGVQDVGEAHARFHEVFGRPACQLFDRTAQKQRGAVLIQLAAEGHAWQVADQRAVLLFTAAHRLFHLLAAADIGQETHKQWHAGQRHAAQGQAHIDQIAVFVQRRYLAPHTDDAGVAGLDVAAQVAVVLTLHGLGHQHADVFANHLLGRPAQQALGGTVVGADQAIALDHDDGVHRRVHHGTQAGFAALDVAEELAITQTHIQCNHQQAEQ